MQAMEFGWAIGAGVLSFLLALTGRELLSAPVLQRENYAGREVPIAGGIFAVFALIGITAVAGTVDPFRFGYAIRVSWLTAAFALLGLFDDMVGDRWARGLRGHVAAARRGQVTSGIIKLVFGIAVAWLVLNPVGLVERSAATILIAGSANVANLLDVAPARAMKGALLAFLGVTFFADHALDAGIHWFVFAVLGLVYFELKESLMLGDTGANPLGAAVGFLLAIALQDSTRALWIAAGVVVAVNVAGEFVSFSRVIERVPPLRFLDQLGRRQ